VSWRAIDGGTWPFWRDQMHWELSNGIITCRQDGVTGYGEIAPLEGAATADLNVAWEQFSPSARWGLEMACLDWRARAKRTSPAHLLCANPLESIERHALVEGPAAIRPGFRTYKVKVGRCTPEQDAERLRALGPVRLRLDANSRSMAALWALCGDLAIDYVEDPLEEGPFPVAQDECLRGGCLPERQSGVVAWAVKPSQYGGWSDLLVLAQTARQRGVRLVISMSREGPVGWRSLVAAAAALHAPDEPAGLDGHRLELGSALRLSDVFADYS
jgi:L-alanine-DL-glutamate epimerase-like enolase superfamily enzyme